MLLIAALSGAVAGCDNATPPPGPTASGTPIVRSLVPAVPLPNAAPQTIRLTGLDFRSGLLVSLTLPGGAITDIPSSATRLQSATTLDVDVTLVDPGQYRVVVLNANGFRSDSFLFSMVVVNPSGDLSDTVTLTVN